MDNKMKIVMGVLGDMGVVLNTNQLTMLKDTLIKTLNGYEVTESQTSKYDLMTLDEFNDTLMAEYFKYKIIQGIAKGSIEQYVRETRKCLYSLNKKVTDITTDDLELYLTCYKIKQGVSSTTINNMKRYINNFFLFLVDKEYIHRNPCEHISKIKGDTIPEKAFTKIEEEKLYDSCDNLRDKALVNILFSTGCRVGEIVNTNIDNIDFDKHTIDVVGKGNKHRTVFVSDKAIYHLKKYLNSRTDNNVAVFVGLNKNAKRLSVDGIESVLRKLGKRANIQNVHPHRCRATVATRLLDMGMKVEQVSQILGHAQIDTTMIYYRGNYNLNNDYNKLTNNM